MEIQLNKSESLSLTKKSDYIKYAGFVALSLLSDITYAFISSGASDKVMNFANTLIQGMRVPVK
jgi:hypothetical protein